MAVLDTVGILLAAGCSSRFGSDKLLHPLPDGTPMAIASARILKTAISRVLVVVRPDSTRLIDLLAPEPMEIILCQEAVSGMGASIACGVTASAQAQGWVIALADMPFIQPFTVAQVVALLHQNTMIVAPQYQGQRGHPVGFHHLFGPQLRRLEGDHGAWKILQQYCSQLTLFACNDKGVLWDIDTPEKLRAV